MQRMLRPNFRCKVLYRCAPSHSLFGNAHTEVAEQPGSAKLTFGCLFWHIMPM